MNTRQKNNLTAIKRGLQSGIPTIGKCDKLDFGRYKNIEIEGLMWTRPNYLLWLEKQRLIILEPDLRETLKELRYHENIKSILYDSQYDEYDMEDDLCGLTAFDLGADF